MPQKGLFNLIFPTVSLSLPVCLSACLPSLCVSRRQTGGHEICSTCIRVNQPTLALQSTTPLGSWSERLGRRDSCVVDTQTSPATYPLFSKASRRYSTHTHTVHWFQSLNQRWTVSSLPQPWLGVTCAFLGRYYYRKCADRHLLPCYSFLLSSCPTDLGVFLHFLFF